MKHFPFSLAQTQEGIGGLRRQEESAAAVTSSLETLSLAWNCVLPTANLLGSLAALGRALAKQHLATQSFPHVDSHHLECRSPLWRWLLLGLFSAKAE